MIEKALIVIVFMYAVSFSLLGGQFVMDTFGITMTNTDGVEIRSSLLSIVDTDNINTVTGELVDVNGTAAGEDPFGVAAVLTVELLQLMTGTYIFNILFLFGVPAIFVYGMVVLYALLLFRALIAYLRGI